MRKVAVGFMVGLLCGLSPVCVDFELSKSLHAQKANAEVESANDEAEILFEDAIALKKQGKVLDAIEIYAKAIRKSRSILAFDDEGLIEALQKDREKKLIESPDNIELLETLGFIAAVCYSDSENALSYYQKVYDLVDDEKVKEKTAMLMERIKATAEVQSSVQSEYASQLREERLKAWSEMEKVEKFGASEAEAQANAARLSEMYKNKDDLKNRVPQLEKELQELQDERDKANRMWHTLKDDLYQRRRRRLDDDIEAKKEELKEAAETLSEAEDAVEELEKEVLAVKQANEMSPIRSYKDDGSKASRPELAPPQAKVSPLQPPDNDYGQPPSEESSNENAPLPAVENPDFPQNDNSAGEVKDPDDQERVKKLEKLINSL